MCERWWESLEDGVRTATGESCAGREAASPGGSSSENAHQERLQGNVEVIPDKAGCLGGIQTIDGEFGIELVISTQKTIARKKLNNH